ncbi:MAG: exodeoxyribonuclease VII small subunit [Lachnospiraceae bacterium]|nr:exodeoxyribonuclease VII small subunit [Lachnospiraceae bacterium]
MSNTDEKNEKNDIKDGFDAGKMSVEEIFTELDRTLSGLNRENVPLEEGFALYKKGIDLLKVCNEKIEKVEKEVLVMNEEGDLNEYK